MERRTLTSVGGITAALLASLCCIGPLLVAFLGIGSIAAFSVFETYRPYLIGLTILLIASAFYLTYRKREVKCEDGTCKIEGASKFTKAGVWTVTVLAGLAIAFPYFGFAPQTSANKSVDSTSVVTLNISGMDCEACAAGLETSLSGMNGVRKAGVDFQKGKATIEYNDNVVKPIALVNRVHENGFTATIEKGK
ncbi:MAG: cation transporter [Bacteroidota bacterium]|nr:cation transporter [Bacteroidota bacterium]